MKANDQLEAYVREVEANLHRQRAAIAQAIRTQLTVPVDGGLGTVTVSGAGQLVSVDLSANAPWMTTAARLSAAITRAVRQAEQQAKASRVLAATENGSAQ